MATDHTRMVADVGGTNSRIALYDPVGRELRALHTFINRDYARFEDVIASWLAGLDEPAPVDGCIAVAAPLNGDRVTMVNMHWAFSGSDLRRRFGLQRMRLINDFEANAYALTHLGPADRETLHPGRHGRAMLATVGPGTGLGGATAEQVAGEVRVRACEPGHMGLSPGTPLELELFRHLLTKYDNIYAELLVSGPGLLRLYRGLGEVLEQPAAAESPAEVSRRGQEGEEELASLALQTFCALLGSACGDFLLANGAYGGLFLAGGIVPRMIPFLRDSDFHARLLQKGAMGEHLAQVPVYAITTAQPGLLGAAHAPLEPAG
jgi:glucokinase